MPLYLANKTLSLIGFLLVSNISCLFRNELREIKLTLFNLGSNHTSLGQKSSLYLCNSLCCPIFIYTPDNCTCLCSQGWKLTFTRHIQPVRHQLCCTVIFTSGGLICKSLQFPLGSPDVREAEGCAEQV